MLDTILAYGKCILDFVLLFWFTMQFFTLRWEKRRLVSWGLLSGLSTVQYFINLLYIPELNTMTALLCSLIFNLMLFKGSIAARILCSFFEVLLFLICESIPVLIYASMVRVNMIAAIDDTIKNAGFDLCSTGLFCIILLAARYFHWLKQRKEDMELTITENLSIITVPAVSIFIIYYVFNILSLNTELGNRADSLSMLFFLGVLFMNLAVILGDNHWRKRCQLQHELGRMSRIEQLDRVVIGQQDAFIEELKGLAHDYTKQIDGIKHLLQEGAGGGEESLWSVISGPMRTKCFIISKTVTGSPLSPHRLCGRSCARHSFAVIPRKSNLIRISCSLTFLLWHFLISTPSLKIRWKMRSGPAAR